MRVTIRCKSATVLKSDKEENGICVVMSGVDEDDIDNAKVVLQSERMWDDEVDKLELPEDFRIK